MKTKRLFGLLLVAVIAITMVFALTACGGNTDDDDDTNPTHSITGTSFQLTGEYDEVRDYGFAYHFLMMLNADGTATMGEYQSMSFEAYADAVESGSLKTSSGTWEKGKDKSGTDSLVITVGTDKFYAYQGASGNLSLSDYTFSLMGQATRTISLSGSATSTYASMNAFVTAKIETRPTISFPIEVAGATTGGMSFKAVFAADFTIEYFMLHSDAWTSVGTSTWSTDGTAVTINYGATSTTLAYNAYNSSPSFALNIAVAAEYAPTVTFTFSPVTHNSLLYSANYYVTALINAE